MAMRFWIRNLFIHPAPRPIRKAPRRFRLAVEVLEDRWVPSVLGSSALAVPGIVPVQVMGSQGTLVDLITAAPTGYTPQQLRTAYGLNQVSFAGIKGDGAGQTIALVDAYDNPSFVNSTDPNFNTSALHIFDQTFGLPDPPSFTKVNQNGQAAPLATAGGLVRDWGSETALDVEWAHAMAPAASIILVEANTVNDLVLAAGTAGKLASVVSMSWGGFEYSGELSLDSTFQQPGVTFLASTGDEGAPPEYPASSPHVVAVGGTSLYNLDSKGDYPGTGTNGEVGWSLGSDSYNPSAASGGGISQFETEPSYQESVQSTGFRTIPDISADADPSTGVPIYDPYDLGTVHPWVQVGGTSLASPLMAGMVAQADQGRVLSGGQTFSSDQILAALYSVESSKPSDFHDILYGNNGFNAGPGYDEVTGLGTPNGSQLVPDLAYFGLSSRPTLTAIAVTPSSPTVYEGFTQQFTATGTFASGLTQDITSSVSWTSATPSVATIDASGLATTQAAGTSNIAAKLNGVTSPSDTLTSVPLVSLAIAPNNPSVPVLLSVPFTVTGTYSDGSTHELASTSVAWASSKPSVATINSAGLAKSIALGTSFITASLLGVTSPRDVFTAAAPTFVVNTTKDDDSFTGGKTSLREAILAADAYAGHAVTFDPAVFASAKTITLTLGVLELTDATGTETIVGPKAGVTVDAGGASGVFQVDRLVTASISGLTITGGGNVNSGGGLYNLGTATLTNCSVSGNSAAVGGGVQNYGSLALTHCTVSENSAAVGGGILNFYGALAMTACTVSDNSASYGGGGVYNYAGTLALTNCTVSGNSAVEDGGGVRNTSAAKLNLTNCAVTGNSANLGGGLSNQATATLTNSSVSGNSAIAAGGVFNYPGSLTMTNCSVSGNVASGGGGGVYNVFGSLAMTNCSISGNSSIYGGGLSNYAGTATLTNCSVSGNSAVVDGGGLFGNGGTLALTNCTVSSNSATYGAGLFNNRGTLALTNCTVSGNSATYGAGVYVNFGMATLANCTISGNTATTSGGGLQNYAGTLALTNCTVSGNSAGGSGGGLFNLATTTLTNCTVSRNTAGGSGGGLATSFGAITLTNVTVNANQANGATAQGGGIYAFQSTVDVQNSTVNGNQANGATAQGGGIYAYECTVDMRNATVNANEANGAVLAQGGGIYAYQTTVNMQNATVNGNQANGATAQGGGIYAYQSTVDMKNSTVNGNDANGSVLGQGGGIYSDGTLVLTLANSTVNGNKATTSGNDIFA